MDAATKTKIGTGVGGGVAVVALASLVFGAVTFLHGVGDGADAQATTYTAPVASSVSAPAQDEDAAQAIYDQQIAQAKADAEAAAAAKAAADAAAARAAADAAKRTQRQSETPVKRPVWVVDSNPGNEAGGYWDTSPCGTAGATYAADGSAVCAG